MVLVKPEVQEEWRGRQIISWSFNGNFCEFIIFMGFMELRVGTVGFRLASLPLFFIVSTTRNLKLDKTASKWLEKQANSKTHHKNKSWVIFIANCFQKSKLDRIMFIFIHATISYKIQIPTNYHIASGLPVACEQALLFGQAKRASQERASEGPTRLTRPNRRPCSQARLPVVQETSYARFLVKKT